MGMKMMIIYLQVPVSRSSSASFVSESERSGNVSRRRGTSVVEPLSSTTADSLSRNRSRARHLASEAQTQGPSSVDSRSRDAGSTNRSLTNDIPAASLSRDKSPRSTTPIIFSQSTVRRKPPPTEKKLECTLENLYFGCVKKIKITRDVIKPPGYVSVTWPSRTRVTRNLDTSLLI